MPEKNSLLDVQADKQQLVQLIVFRAGDEEFCVPIDAVQEIIKIGEVTPIPDAPFFIKGLINVRGDIVVIIDVRALFALPTPSIESSKHIIITKQTSGLFGLMVDEVLEVLRVNNKDINTTPSIITKIHEKYVLGIVVYENRLFILLDLSYVLSQQELTRLAEEARVFKNKLEKEVSSFSKSAVMGKEQK